MKQKLQSFFGAVRRRAAAFWQWLRRFAATPRGQVTLILLVCVVIAAVVLIKFISTIPIYHQKANSTGGTVSLGQSVPSRAGSASSAASSKAAGAARASSARASSSAAGASSAAQTSAAASSSSASPSAASSSAASSSSASSSPASSSPASSSSASSSPASSSSASSSPASSSASPHEKQNAVSSQ